MLVLLVSGFLAGGEQAPLKSAIALFNDVAAIADGVEVGFVLMTGGTTQGGVHTFGAP